MSTLWIFIFFQSDIYVKNNQYAYYYYNSYNTTDYGVKNKYPVDNVMPTIRFSNSTRKKQHGYLNIFLDNIIDVRYSDDIIILYIISFFIIFFFIIRRKKKNENNIIHKCKR